MSPARRRRAATSSSRPTCRSAPATRRAAERARFRRDAADLLITTPESLYLLLTSRARDVLRAVETVIVDEIHSLVPTKRGAHLALSLERLQAAVRAPDSADRPVGDAAAARRGRALSRRRRPCKGAGGERGHGRRAATRSAPEASLRDEFNAGDERRRVPAGHDRRRASAEAAGADGRSAGRGPGAAGQAGRDPERPGIAGPRSAVDLVEHPPAPARADPLAPTTLLFANSRRLAERLAGAINELAGETVARAHHGSLSREQRIEIEDALKAGRIPALVATSSLELGIDMGAIDLVVQIEAPPSVASGMQRIGRASHQVNAVSEGIIFPKFRGDLVACAAVTRAMHEGLVEATRYPRNPLDVLAQQVVAMVAMDPWRVDDLYDAVRGRGAVRRALAGASSRASSTCSRAATRRTSSRNFGRDSPGTGSAAR